jgi:hypothetical protein
MAFTRHGYHIPGSPNDMEGIPTFPVKCGGPLVCLGCNTDIYEWRQKDPVVTNPNSGAGWYEFIHPTKATTNIAHVAESGDIYLPEDGITMEDFVLASSRGNIHRLIRADDVNER